MSETRQPLRKAVAVCTVVVLAVLQACAASNQTEVRDIGMDSRLTLHDGTLQAGVTLQESPPYGPFLDLEGSDRLTLTDGTRSTNLEGHVAVYDGSVQSVTAGGSWSVVFTRDNEAYPSQVVVPDPVTLLTGPAPGSEIDTPQAELLVQVKAGALGTPRQQFNASCSDGTGNAKGAFSIAGEPEVLSMDAGQRVDNRIDFKIPVPEIISALSFEAQRHSVHLGGVGASCSVRMQFGVATTGQMSGIPHGPTGSIEAESVVELPLVFVKGALPQD